MVIAAYAVAGLVLQCASIFLIDDRLTGLLLSVFVAFPFYYNAATALLNRRIPD